MAKLYDLVFVGNYTKDTIVSKAGSRNVHGGAVNYGAQVAARLGFTAAVVTRLAKEDSEVVDILEKAGVDVYPEYVPKSTTVILEYPTDNVDHRIIHLKGYAGSITVEQVEGVQGKIFAIGPSIRGEVPLEVIQAIKEKGGEALPRRAGVYQSGGRRYSGKSELARNGCIPSPCRCAENRCGGSSRSYGGGGYP